MKTILKLKIRNISLENHLNDKIEKKQEEKVFFAKFLNIIFFQSVIPGLTVFW